MNNQKGLPLRSFSAEGGQIQVLILAGIVILIALAGGIFFLGRVIAPKPQNVASSPQPSPTPDQTVYTESDRSANWKTYTQSGLGSFKYPTYLSSCSNCGVSIPEGALEIANFADLSTVRIASDAPWDGFIVYTLSRKSFAEFIKEEKQILSGGPGCSPDNLINETSITINSSTGVILSGICEGRTDVFVPFPNSQKILGITRLEVSPKSFDKTFNQILSTFRFTN